MVQIIGAGLLLIASAALGFGAAGELDARVRDLEILIFSLELMERELNARLTPLPELLQLVSQEVRGNVKSFYLLCASGLDRQREQLFSEIWREAADAAQLRISGRDLQILANAGTVLGRYDVASQCRALIETRDRLATALEEAKEQKRKMGKVYRTLGVTSGALLGIILL